MSRLRIAPIVEGHGEEKAIRILLQRIWVEFLGGDWVQVVQPIRSKRTQLVQPRELGRVIDLAMLKLRAGESRDPGMILVLLDADEDAPCRLGPELQEIARRHRSDADLSCVVANVEYETWFVAAAASLSDQLDLSRDQRLPENPEESRLGKAWIQQRFLGVKYSETVDQPSMTSRMDLRLARDRSPSFDKLCRELEKRLAQ